MSQAVPELMNHQEEGVEFLLSRRSGLLAFEQGLGKTLVAIEAYRRLRKARLANSMLVICPNSLKAGWAAEIARFASELKVTTISGPPKERRDALSSGGADVVVINYEAARTEVLALRALARSRKMVLVLDESHHVKNSKSLTTLAAQHLAPYMAYRWLLTGTPVTNSPEDIFSQLSLVAPDASSGLGILMLDFKQAATDPVACERLAARVSPYLLRRTKEQCLDLPEKTFVDLNISLPSWQRTMYDEVRNRLIECVEGMSADAFAAYAPNALVELLRLSQIASNPRLVYPEEARTPAKFLEIDALLDELIVGSGRKVVLWSHYVGTIKQLVQRYEHLGTAAIYGEVAPDERQTIANRFQVDGETRLLIANPAAAGTGFTLTAATYTIYETLSWRYDFYAQSQDRIHRIGQQVPVTYLRLLAEDTIDSVIAESLQRKTAIARTIVGDGLSSTSISRLTPEAFSMMLRSNVLPIPLST